MDDQLDLIAFAEKARKAIDDIADSFEADEERTLDEWMEELQTVIHHDD